MPRDSSEHIGRYLIGADVDATSKNAPIPRNSTVFRSTALADMHPLAGTRLIGSICSRHSVAFPPAVTQTPLFRFLYAFNLHLSEQYLLVLRLAAYFLPQYTHVLTIKIAPP